MNIIKTIAPISIDDLKKYFVDKDIKFLIDYENSKLKGTKLLTYLSNLDIPSDIAVDENTDEFFELLKDYFNSPFLLNIDTLERAAIDVLLCAKGMEDHPRLPEFIVENKEIIDQWITVLDSLTLFNMYIINDPGFQEFVESKESDPGDSLVGINFVSLLKHPDFYDYFTSINKDNVKYYKGYFNDYMFKGKNLFSFWANEFNPLYLMFAGIIAGVDSNDYKDEFEQAFKDAHSKEYSQS
jgi:hypothetical protein